MVRWGVTVRRDGQSSAAGVTGRLPRAGIGRLRTVALTAATLVCFAANSLLCRAALRPRLIDAATFTSIRLVSGAAALALILAMTKRERPAGGSVGSAVALFAYAGAFSLAYVRIGAGVGALLLFGAVQVTMLGWSVARGARPGWLAWFGIAIGLGGLACLALPGASAPDPAGAALMVAAGVAWGAYSIRGGSARDPLATNADNFLRAVPFTLALSAVLLRGFATTRDGVLLAAASGAPPWSSSRSPCSRGSGRPLSSGSASRRGWRSLVRPSSWESRWRCAGGDGARMEISLPIRSVRVRYAVPPAAPTHRRARGRSGPGIGAP